MRSIAKLIAATCLLFVLAASPALPYAFSPWGSATGEGVIGLQPMFVYGNSEAPLDDTIGAQLYLLYGITDKLDVIVDVLPLSISPTMEYGNNSGFVRYELIPGLLGALGFTIPTSGGDVDFDLQVHYTKDLGPQMVLQANLFLNSLLEKKDLRTLGAYLAFNYYFNADRTFGIYLELDPALPLAEGSKLNIGVVPGIYAAFGPEGKYSLSLGMLNSLYDGSFNVFDGLGLWMYTSF